MNRDSRIIIYGSVPIMVLVMASSLLCDCSYSVANTLIQTGAGMGVAGLIVAFGYDYLLDDNPAAE